MLHPHIRGHMRLIMFFDLFLVFLGKTDTVNLSLPMKKVKDIADYAKMVKEEQPEQFAGFDEPISADSGGLKRKLGCGGACECGLFGGSNVD